MYKPHLSPKKTKTPSLFMSMIWHEKQPLDAEFYSHLPDARGGPCMAMPAGLMEGRLAINVLASMEKQIGRAYMGYGWINGCPIGDPKNHQGMPWFGRSRGWSTLNTATAPKN
jgi:hypothetical protein